MAFKVPTRTQGEPAASRKTQSSDGPRELGSRLIPAKLSFSPLYRAVTRSMRSHRNPCHRRANHRWFAAPCGSGPASHRFRSNLLYANHNQNDCGGKSVTAIGRWSSTLCCPLDPRLFAPRFRQSVGTLVAHGKAGVCARNSIKTRSRDQFPQVIVLT